MRNKLAYIKKKRGETGTYREDQTRAHHRNVLLYVTKPPGQLIPLLIRTLSSAKERDQIMTL